QQDRRLATPAGHALWEAAMPEPSPVREEPSPLGAGAVCGDLGPPSVRDGIESLCDPVMRLPNGAPQGSCFAELLLESISISNASAMSRQQFPLSPHFVTRRKQASS